MIILRQKLYTKISPEKQAKKLARIKKQAEKQIKKRGYDPDILDGFIKQKEKELANKDTLGTVIKDAGKRVADNVKSLDKEKLKEIGKKTAEGVKKVGKNVYENTGDLVAKGLGYAVPYADMVATKVAANTIQPILGAKMIAGGNVARGTITALFPTSDIYIPGSALLNKVRVNKKHKMPDGTVKKVNVPIGRIRKQIAKKVENKLKEGFGEQHWGRLGGRSIKGAVESVKNLPHSIPQRIHEKATDISKVLDPKYSYQNLISN